MRPLLGLILLVVQAGALAHALSHEVDAPQDQVCLTCLAAQPAGGAPVASEWSVVLDAVRSSPAMVNTPRVISRSVSRARQRAPPSGV